VAHDFNNMLGIITGYSELLISELDEDLEHTQYVEEILRAGKRGASLTSKLLAYSRRRVMESSAIDLNSLLRQQQDMLQKVFTVRVNLSIEYQDDLWLVWLNEGELEDALINLCINAMHAMSHIQSGAQLTIRTGNISLNSNEAELLGLNAGDYAQLIVADNGCGMDRSVREKIFDPFFTTKKEQGSGLGLSQTYGFAKRSGGAIAVTSDLKLGAQFTLFFPRKEIEEMLIPSEVGSRNLGGHESILVVDDEPALRHITSEFLRKKGYDVQLAENGIEALSILETRKIDVLFTDVIMPEMDGYELAAIVQDKYPRVKIQLASGFAKESSPEGLNKTLWENIIEKPFSSAVLCEEIRILLDG
jgi:CheY-like chemotaxis protein